MMHETHKLHELAADGGLLPRYRKEVKVMTVGTFDIFHRGHANLLRGLRSFGGFVVVGVHDDDSYFRLKKKHPIDSLKERMDKVKPFADVVFAIPDIDPTPVSQVRTGTTEKELNVREQEPNAPVYVQSRS